MRTCILRERSRALITAVCMVMFLFGSVPGPAAVCRADADAGADPAGISCEAGNENCLLLQMVMRGDFASFDAEDVLHQRIYSAVLVKMKAVTEEDLRHYCAEFGRGEDSVREQYDLALSNCLLAEILYKQTSGEEISDAERVLLLFLEAREENPDTSSAETAESERVVIRDRITEETISRIASESGLEEAYVKRLISASRSAPF